MKRGQLTTFVIIAIVVVAAIIGYYWISSNDSGVLVDSNIKPVYDVVSSCIDDVSEDAIAVVGESGGYYNLPEKVDEQKIAYHFYEGDRLIPSLNRIEREMASYVVDMVTLCVEDKADEISDYEISFEVPDVGVFVNDDDTISFVVNYPFSAVKGENSYYFDSPIEKIFDVRLYTIYSFVSMVADEHEREPRAFCMNCIGDKSFEDGLVVDLWTFNPNDVIFIIIDEKSLVNGAPYHFFFANKYPSENDYDPFESF